MSKCLFNASLAVVGSGEAAKQHTPISISKNFHYGVLVALDTLYLLGVYVDVAECASSYRELTQEMDK